MQRFFLFVSLLFVSASLYALELTPIFELHSWSYSEASGVYQMAKDRWKDSPSKSGKHAFTRNRLNSGLQIEWFSVAYHQRQDMAFAFSPDTAELIHYKKTKKQLPQGQHYQLKLKAKQLEAEGLRLGLHLPEWQGLQLTAYLYYLQGKSFQQGSISGVFAEEQGDKSIEGYFGQGSIRYAYHKDKLLEHQIKRPNAEGYATDIHLSWQYKSYELNAFIEDALFSMNWRGAGFTNGQLSSDNKSFDSQGFVKYKALLHGRRGYNKLKQKNISTYSGIEGAYYWNEWRFSLATRRYSNLYFPATEITWRPPNGNHIVGLAYEAKSRLISVSYFWQKAGNSKIGFSFGSDKTSLRYAKSLELSLIAKYAF